MTLFGLALGGCGCFLAVMPGSTHCVGCCERAGYSQCFGLTLLRCAALGFLEPCNKLVWLVKTKMFAAHLHLKKQLRVDLG